MSEEKAFVQIYAGGTWLGDNLPHFEKLQTKLKELDTRSDSIPNDFQPRVFLQFIRGAVNEIKRLTAENHAFRESLQMKNTKEK